MPVGRAFPHDQDPSATLAVEFALMHKTSLVK
jgi:hypothetical protein